MEGRELRSAWRRDAACMSVTAHCTLRGGVVSDGSCTRLKLPRPPCCGALVRLGLGLEVRVRVRVRVTLTLTLTRSSREETERLRRDLLLEAPDRYERFCQLRREGGDALRRWFEGLSKIAQVRR